MAAFTRKLVQEAFVIFREIGLEVSAFLPGKDGLDSVQIDSGNPLLTTITSTIGLHFEDVFVLSFDKSVVRIHNNEAFEMVVTRAICSLSFFYTEEMAEPLTSLPSELFVKPLYQGDVSF